jgi:hypothetical protein
LTYGLGKLVASTAPRNGSSGSSDRVCCPATMIIGALLRYAVKTWPSAWPTPPAECRFTSAGRRAVRAYPSAIATTAAS